MILIDEREKIMCSHVYDTVAKLHYWNEILYLISTSGGRTKPCCIDSLAHVRLNLRRKIFQALGQVQAIRQFFMT